MTLTLKTPMQRLNQIKESTDSIERRVNKVEDVLALYDKGTDTVTQQIKMLTQRVKGGQ